MPLRPRFFGAAHVYSERSATAVTDRSGAEGGNPAPWVWKPALKGSGTMIRWLGRWLLRVLVAIAAIALVAFAIDWTVYKLRGSPHSTVTVSQFLSVPLKGQKVEYDYLGSVDVSCSISLFPQGGQEPCWYLRRNPNQWDKAGSPAY